MVVSTKPSVNQDTVDSESSPSRNSSQIRKGRDLSYTGISQSAIREMSLCSDLNHVNIIKLVETILEEKSIFMVFEYAEHDLLQIIHHHTQLAGQQIPTSMIRS
jgi:cyclin-dependent kinase 8/11